MNLNKMKKKNILIVVGIILGISAATFISVKVNQKIREVRVERAEKMKKERKEEKIKKEEKAEKERRRIALWCVQNLEGPEIKEIKVGPVTKLGIAGTGGTSIDVEINNMKKNSISFIVDSEDLAPKAGTFDPHSEYDFTKKTDKSKNLKGIKVEEWKEN